MRRPLLLSTVLIASATVIGSAAALAVSPSGTSTAHVIVFAGDLDSSHVVGGTPSTATGSAVVRIDTVLKTIATDLTWTGLTGPADRSHLHSGPAGSPTDNVFFHEVLTPEARTVIPCGWDLAVFADCVPPSGSSHDILDISGGYGGCTDFQCIVDTAVPNGFFIDMHTELYPAGEIRGQLVVVPRQPDARVRVGASGPFTGNNIYSFEAIHQVVTAKAPAGGTVSYEVSIQNDAPKFKDSFRVEVAGPDVPGYAARYYAGATDITAAVVAGTFHTRKIPPGGSSSITVVIHVKAAAATGSAFRRTLTAISDGDPAESDAVKVIARRR